MAGKDILKERIWTPLVVDSKILYTKTLFEEEQYVIIVTDLLKVWQVIVGLKQFEEEKKLYNPHLEITSVKLISLFKEFFSYPTKSNVHSEFMVNQEDYLVLKFSMKIASYPFTWSFHCPPYGDQSSYQSGELIPDSSSSTLQATFLRDSFLIPVFVVHNELVRQRSFLLSQLLQKGNSMRLACHQKDDILDEAHFTSTMLESRHFKELLKKTPVIFDASITREIFQRFLIYQDHDMLSSQGSSISSFSSNSCSFDPLLSDIQEFTTNNNSSETISSLSNFGGYEETPEELKRRKEIEERLRLAEMKKAKKQSSSKRMKFV